MYHDLPIENIFSIISHVSLPEGRSLSRNHGWNHGFSTWFVVQNWDHDRFKHWWTQKWNDAVSIGDPRWPSLRSSAWGRNTSGFSTSSVPASKTGVRFSIDIWKDSVSWRPLPRSFLEVRGHIAGIIWPQKNHRQSKVDRRWTNMGIWWNLAWPKPGASLMFWVGNGTICWNPLFVGPEYQGKHPKHCHPTESHRSPTGFQVTQVWQSHAFCTKFAARHHNNKSQEITWGTFLCDLYHNYRFRSDKSHLDRLHGFCDWGNSEIRDPQSRNHHPERALNHLEGRYPKSLLGMVNDKHQKISNISN